MRNLFVPEAIILIFAIACCGCDPLAMNAFLTGFAEGMTSYNSGYDNYTSGQPN